MKVSTTTGSNITKFAEAGVAFGIRTKLAVDGLIADGVTPEAMEAPAKDGDRVFYDSLLNLIQAGMPKAAQAVLNAQARDLSEEKKAERRYQMQQRGSLLGKLRAALRKRIEADSRGPATKNTPRVRVSIKLADVVDMIQKMETPDFDVTPVLAKLAEIAKLLK